MNVLTEKLEIVIITYNRAFLLKPTLEKLLDSPFKDCNITILNNCSTDSTIDICSKYICLFPRGRVITNAINIGGDANILRAVEIASAEYLWILADDDDYDFADCDDVIKQISIGEYDLIHVGAHTDIPWTYGGTGYFTKDLVSAGYTFFRFSSFLPCNIFRRKEMIPYIIAGYRNIINLYPHMPFLLSFYDKNKKTYIAKNQIVKAIIGHQNYSSKSCLNGWLNTSFLLKNKSDVRLCFFDQFLISNKLGKLRVFANAVCKKTFSSEKLQKIFNIMSISDKILILIGLLPALVYLKIKKV